MTDMGKSIFGASVSILSLHSDAFDSVPPVDPLSWTVANVTDEVCERTDPNYATAVQILDAATAMEKEPAGWPLGYAITVLEVAFEGAPCGYIVQFRPVLGDGVAGIIWGAVGQSESRR